MTFSKTSVLQVRCSENWWIIHRYLIEAIQPYTHLKKNLIFCCLFGASFMLIACSEVKILKKKKENLESQTFTSKNHNLGHE